MLKKWRPALWVVLGGALAATLALSVAGLVTFRWLGPQIGHARAAVLIAAALGALTAGLGVLLVRLLLRPVAALAAYAHRMRLTPQNAGNPPAHFGTVELFDMAGSVVDMAASLQSREAATLTFIDHVTHELKTPVSTLRAAAELLGDSADVTAADRRLVDQIGSAVAQMQIQLEVLRSVARARETDHRGATCLDDLQLNHPGLLLKVEGGALPIPLSAAGLTIVLGHLIGNAREHGATEVRLSTSPTQGATVFDVTDNGSGISPGNRARIFAPFFTTRRAEGGTGMGLTIVANLLRAHHADIELQTAEATTFRISFREPRTAALPGQHPVLRSPRAARSIDPKRTPFSYRDDPNVPKFDDAAPVAVMDAECAICSWGARMIHRMDRSGAVRICPIQSPRGSALLRHYGLKAEDPSTWLFIEQGVAHVDFDAVIHAGQRFGGWGRLTAVLRLLPKAVRDWLYQRLARNRYALFGRGDMCALPDPAFQRRLMR